MKSHAKKLGWWSTSLVTMDTDLFRCAFVMSDRSAPGDAPSRRARLTTVPACIALSLTRGVYHAGTGQVHKKMQRILLNPVVCLNQFVHEDYPAVPDAYGAYHLQGMVIHCGRSLDTGHFYCYQLVRNKWYLFNDAKVTPASWEDLEGVARGDRAWHCPTILFYASPTTSKAATWPRQTACSQTGQRRTTPGLSSADLCLVSSLRRGLARQQRQPLDQPGRWKYRKYRKYRNEDLHQQQACCTRRPLGEVHLQ